MIQHTANKPIAELFSSENQVSYYIPKYQREYVWSKFNWESLFDDIYDSEGSHFMGSIICINIQTDSLSAPKLELVDGQQRMTTLIILFCVQGYTKAMDIWAVGCILGKNIKNSSSSTSHKINFSITELYIYSLY